MDGEWEMAIRDGRRQWEGRAINNIMLSSQEGVGIDYGS